MTKVAFFCMKILNYVNMETDVRGYCICTKGEESILDSTTAVDKRDINKTFQNLQNINDKFECENCEFVTTAISYFEEHIDVEKRHCHICDDDYYCVDNLKSHLFLQHKIAN